MSNKLIAKNETRKDDGGAAVVKADTIPIGDLPFSRAITMQLGERAVFVYLTYTDCRIFDPSCKLGSYWFSPAATAREHYEMLVGMDRVTVRQLVAAGWTYRQKGIEGLYCDKAGNEPDNPAALAVDYELVAENAPEEEWRQYACEVLAGKRSYCMDGRGVQWVECFLRSCTDVLVERYRGRGKTSLPSADRDESDPELTRLWALLGDTIGGHRQELGVLAAANIETLVCVGLGRVEAARVPMRQSREFLLACGKEVESTG